MRNQQSNKEENPEQLNSSLPKLISEDTSIHEASIKDLTTKNFDYYNSAFDSVSHTTLQAIRLIFFVPTLFIAIVSLYKLGWKAQFIFMTNWGNHFACIALILAFYFGQKRPVPNSNNESKLYKGVKGFTSVLTELTFVMQVIIVLIYWPILHEMTLVQIAPLNDWVLHQLIVHIHWFPALAITIEVFLSRIVFIQEHVWILIYLGTFYLFVNFCGTKLRGQPIYPFLPWNDLNSYLISCGLVGFGVVSFSSICYLTNKCKKFAEETTHSHKKSS